MFPLLVHATLDVIPNIWIGSLNIKYHPAFELVRNIAEMSTRCTEYLKPTFRFVLQTAKK